MMYQPYTAQNLYPYMMNTSQYINQSRYDHMQEPNAQSYGVIRVNGENGARAFYMPPNKEALLLDETAPIVWFVQTDGAGYKTIAPYDMAPHQIEEQSCVKTLEERIARLEKIVQNEKPDIGKNRQSQEDTIE